MYLEKRLGQISLLRNLQPAEIRQICQFSVEKRFNENDFVIKKGDFADAFYFIIEGKARIQRKNKNGEIVLLSELEADDYFGEQGYLNNSIRTSSVKALSDLKLLEISYEVFDIISKKSLDFSEYLKNVSLGRSIANLQTQLHCIDSHVKRALFTTAKDTELTNFKAGEIIFKKGDKSDFVYFITSGTVELIFDDQKTKTLQIDDSHLFGELGVVNQKPRQATAQAKTTVSLITIPADEFINAFKRTMGLKDLINAYEHVYALPYHEIISEQYLGDINKENAIITKYIMPFNKIAICALAIDRSFFSMEIKDAKPDKTFLFAMNNVNKIEISFKQDVIVSIKAQGATKRLYDLCELLLIEKHFPDTTPDAVLEFLNNYHRPLGEDRITYW